MLLSGLVERYSISKGYQDVMRMERERGKAAGEKGHRFRDKKKITEGLWLLGKCTKTAGI